MKYRHPEEYRQWLEDSRPRPWRQRRAPRYPYCDGPTFPPPLFPPYYFWPAALMIVVCLVTGAVLLWLVDRPPAPCPRSRQPQQRTGWIACCSPHYRYKIYL